MIQSHPRRCGSGLKMLLTPNDAFATKSHRLLRVGLSDLSIQISKLFGQHPSRMDRFAGTKARQHNQRGDQVEIENSIHINVKHD